MEAIAADFLKLYRQKLCKLQREVMAMERAINMVSHGYFDAHDILFADVRAELETSGNNANLLVRGFNLFGADNGRAAIDTAAIEPTKEIEQLLNESVMLSRCHALAAGGRYLKLDELLRLFNLTNTSRSTGTPKKEEY